MSIKVFGILELNKGLKLDEEIDLSFLVVAIAIKNKFGVNLGGNIFSGFRKKYGRSSKKIFIFEITDDPLDINADSLFIGDNIGEYICEIDFKVNEISPRCKEDTGESLLSRISRVQNFLRELLRNEYIYKITLDINALDINEEDVEIIEISIDDFCEKMIELYKREDNWTPTVRLIVSKKD